MAVAGAPTMTPVPLKTCWPTVAGVVRGVRHRDPAVLGADAAGDHAGPGRSPGPRTAGRRLELDGRLAHDPAVLSTASAALVVVGLVSGLLPAARAARVAPIAALRAD